MNKPVSTKCLACTNVVMNKHQFIHSNSLGLDECSLCYSIAFSDQDLLLDKLISGCLNLQELGRFPSSTVGTQLFTSSECVHTGRPIVLLVNMCLQCCYW